MENEKEFYHVRVGTFDLGQLFITPGAQKSLKTVDVIESLKLHASGDYGDISDFDKEANVTALATGDRLLSAYYSNGIRFWIITEGDRSATTVLLPEEY